MKKEGRRKGNSMDLLFSSKEMGVEPRKTRIWDTTISREMENIMTCSFYYNKNPEKRQKSEAPEGR